MSDETTRRALAALDAMAEEWATEINLAACALSIAGKPDVVARIIAFAKQAYIEGAYGCYADVREGRIPWLKVVQ